MNRVKYGALAAVFALTLSGCGGTAAPTPTVTETQAVEVPSTACLEALDAAEVVIRTSGEGLVSSSVVISTIPELIDAMLSFDVGAIEDINTTIEAENNKLSAIDMEGLVKDYETKAAECRGQA